MSMMAVITARVIGSACEGSLCDFSKPYQTMLLVSQAIAQHIESYVNLHKKTRPSSRVDNFKLLRHNGSLATICY